MKCFFRAGVDRPWRAGIFHGWSTDTFGGYVVPAAIVEAETSGQFISVPLPHFRFRISGLWLCPSCFGEFPEPKPERKNVYKCPGCDYITDKGRFA